MSTATAESTSGMDHEGASLRSANQQQEPRLKGEGESRLSCLACGTMYDVRPCPSCFPFTALDHLVQWLVAAASTYDFTRSGEIAEQYAQIAATLRASSDAGSEAIETLRWLDDNAGHEIVIDRDGDDVHLKRWKRRYVSYHDAYGRDVREAVRVFRFSNPKAAP